ncbi:unnamed protein product [Effrenium voratum]|uniref:Tyr recombinase domain-containing protein n=1 Tax=Effrenium voratum TaxID=2562239 RepID=A0AA36JLE8_9DINO|nr:unnamed protein product [Effrenium voratum]
MPRVLLAALFLLTLAPACWCAPRKLKKKSLGQAVALSAQDWQSWAQFVLNEHGPRMYVLIMLTGMFALRAGEAAMLNREDLKLYMSPPRLCVPKEKGRGKSAGHIPIMPEQVQLLQTWISQGVTSSRMVALNQNGKRMITEKYELPAKGRLFAGRKMYNNKKVKQDHLSYHGVWSAVRKLAKKFCTAHPSAASKWEQLRTHSGRATKITMMMGEGVSLAMSMEYARHAKSSIKTHLGYGRLTPNHVHSYLMQERSRQIGLLATMVQTPPSSPSTKTVKKRCRGKQALLPSRATDECQAVKKATPYSALQDCTLKDVMQWQADGKLTDEEFGKIKDSLLKTL